MIYVYAKVFVECNISNNGHIFEIYEGYFSLVRHCNDYEVWSELVSLSLINDRGGIGWSSHPLYWALLQPIQCNAIFCCLFLYWLTNPEKLGPAIEELFLSKYFSWNIFRSWQERCQAASSSSRVTTSQVWWGSDPRLRSAVTQSSRGIT